MYVQRVVSFPVAPVQSGPVRRPRCTPGVLLEALPAARVVGPAIGCSRFNPAIHTTSRCTRQSQSHRSGQAQAGAYFPTCIPEARARWGGSSNGVCGRMRTRRPLSHRGGPCVRGAARRSSPQAGTGAHAGCTRPPAAAHPWPGEHPCPAPARPSLAADCFKMRRLLLSWQNTHGPT
jgi:hypothetical protein